MGKDGLLVVWSLIGVWWRQWGWQGGGKRCVRGANLEHLCMRCRWKRSWLAYLQQQSDEGLRTKATSIQYPVPPFHLYAHRYVLAFAGPLLP